MVICVSPEQQQDAFDLLTEQGETVYKIGEILPADHSKQQITLTNQH